MLYRQVENATNHARTNMTQICSFPQLIAQPF